MSNTDSFIDEVTEEVRRDRLFGYFRRYGWIAIALVALIVGGAAWNEWQKAQARAAAQGFGDALLSASEAADPAAALAAIGGTGQQAALARMLAAAEALRGADDEAGRRQAGDLLAQVAGDAALPPVWRDLAQLRRVLALGPLLPAAERRAALEAMAAPGRPYRTLAQEQLALIAVETGDPASALTMLRALVGDQESPAGLRQRAAQLIVVLGGDGAASEG